MLVALVIRSFVAAVMPRSACVRSFVIATPFILRLVGTTLASDWCSVSAPRSAAVMVTSDAPVYVFEPALSEARVTLSVRALPATVRLVGT